MKRQIQLPTLPSSFKGTYATRPGSSMGQKHTAYYFTYTIIAPKSGKEVEVATSNFVAIDGHHVVTQEMIDKHIAVHAERYRFKLYQESLKVRY